MALGVLLGASSAVASAQGEKHSAERIAESARAAQLFLLPTGTLHWLDEAIVFCDEPGALERTPACAALLALGSGRPLALRDERSPWSRVGAVRVRVGFDERLVRAIDGAL